ncbi:surface-adhesin E family protein [Bisgaard Taxon 45]|uniref:Surface-adhesin protein n=1 Tax=Bisgaard Taxon 45 TaxID=304289 RepID=A0ABT9KET8_9PAST|nr:surface-adhesin E family protein [Bisgaard Taxon 45]
MKKWGWIMISMFGLPACHAPVPVEKPQPPEILLTLPTLIESGFVRLEQNPHQFIDAQRVKIDPLNPNQVYFDVVQNFEKAIYAYPEQPERYAKSSRQVYFVNCESHGLALVSTTYHAEFWGKGEASATQKQHLSLATRYMHSPHRILGQIICKGIYRH